MLHAGARGPEWAREGHEFIRAVKSPKRVRASAPEAYSVFSKASGQSIYWPAKSVTCELPHSAKTGPEGDTCPPEASNCLHPNQD